LQQRRSSTWYCQCRRLRVSATAESEEQASTKNFEYKVKFALANSNNFENTPEGFDKSAFMSSGPSEPQGDRAAKETKGSVTQTKLHRALWGRRKTDRIARYDAESS